MQNGTEETRISGCVTISNNQIIANGKLLFENQAARPRDFFNAAYEALGINYPKFFKMDSLCKTGFLAVEILMKQQRISENAAYQTGILFATANSSLDTDMHYQASTQTMPSPSLFVYTLPNIIIGELCIRHGIKGESACFIFDKFNATFQTEYLNTQLYLGKIEAGISGWADFYDDKFEALFYKVIKSNDPTLDIHNAENADKLYKHLCSH